MLGTSLREQLTRNIAFGEEVRFSRQPQGLTIRRIHGDAEVTQVVDRTQLAAMREELVDEYLGELLWDLATRLRGRPRRSPAPDSLPENSDPGSATIGS